MPRCCLARQVQIPTCHVIGHNDFVKKHSINLVRPALCLGADAAGSPARQER